ncbi:MAG: hypothetical protein ABH827_03610 [bacterium]
MKKQLRTLLLACSLPLMLAISNTPSLYSAKNTEFKETIKKTIKQAIDTAQIKAKLLSDKTKKFIAQHKKAITITLIALSPLAAYFTYKGAAHLFGQKSDPNAPCENVCGYKNGKPYDRCTKFDFYKEGIDATSLLKDTKCTTNTKPTTCYEYDIQKNNELKAQQDEALNQIIKTCQSSKTTCEKNFDKHIENVSNSYCPNALDSNYVWNQTNNMKTNIKNLEKIKNNMLNIEKCSEQACKNSQNDELCYCLNNTGAPVTWRKHKEASYNCKNECSKATTNARNCYNNCETQYK